MFGHGPNTGRFLMVLVGRHNNPQDNHPKWSDACRLSCLAGYGASKGMAPSQTADLWGMHLPATLPVAH